MKEIISKDILAHDIKVITYDGQKEVEAFYSLMIEHAFAVNHIDNKQSMLEEIVDKQSKLKGFLEGKGKLLLLYVDKKLVGTISYSTPNELLSELADRNVEEMYEMGTVFVAPDYQGYGLLSTLLIELKNELLEQGIDEVCFDCGYKKAQTIWTYKYGEANIIKEHFWEMDSHHMIWFVKVNDL